MKYYKNNNSYCRYYYSNIIVDNNNYISNTTRCAQTRFPTVRIGLTSETVQYVVNRDQVEENLTLRHSMEICLVFMYNIILYYEFNIIIL